MTERSHGEVILETLVTIVSDSAISWGVSIETAKLIGDEAATKFSDQFGGFTFYIPKGRLFRTSALYREIWQAYNGRNVLELTKQYGMSMQHIYRILAVERERDRAERQNQLPGL